MEMVGRGVDGSSSQMRLRGVSSRGCFRVTHAHLRIIAHIWIITASKKNNTIPTKNSLKVDIQANCRKSRTSYNLSSSFVAANK